MKATGLFTLFSKSKQERYNIKVAWAVDREFVHIGFWADFDLPLVPFGVLWVPFHWPLDSHWLSWDTLGIHLEHLGPQGFHAEVPLGGKPDSGTSRTLRYRK